MVVQLVICFTWSTHDLKVFQIAFRLHSCNKPNFAPNPVDGHLEKKKFLTRYLAWEITFLDKIVTTLGLQLKDVVNVTSTPIVLKQSNKVAYMRRA
jgi:hypothetical protein